MNPARAMMIGGISSAGNLSLAHEIINSLVVIGRCPMSSVAFSIELRPSQPPPDQLIDRLSFTLDLEMTWSICCHSCSGPFAAALRTAGMQHIFPATAWLSALYPM